jgi:hypothetical protein
MKRSLLLSIAIGTALALLFLFSLEASDAVYQSRLLPWVLPLIYVQDVGFRVAARLFPCQMEGFDTGCEVYKRLPAFVGANALAYTIVLLPMIHSWRRRAVSEKGDRS